jgi:hypothetical protein
MLCYLNIYLLPPLLFSFVGAIWASLLARDGLEAFAIPRLRSATIPLRMKF